MLAALCAAAAPEEAPFMADECLMAIPDFEGIDYTTKEYLNFVQHIRTVVDRLNKEGKLQDLIISHSINIFNFLIPPPPPNYDILSVKFLMNLCYVIFVYMIKQSSLNHKILPSIPKVCDHYYHKVILHYHITVWDTYYDRTGH